jgi:hypothetical protein
MRELQSRECEGVSGARGTRTRRGNYRCTANCSCGEVYTDAGVLSRYQATVCFRPSSKETVGT